MATVNIYDMAQTWNSGGTTFTAIKMNVTDTASAAGSLLLDLQVGGASKFNIDKAGIVSLPATSAVARIYRTFTNASNYERVAVTADGITREVAGTGSIRPFVITNDGGEAINLVSGILRFNSVNTNIEFQHSGVTQWRVDSSGMFVTPTDNTFDIGASGATRPRTGYFGTSVFVGAPGIFSGSGSPEGAVTAPAGSIYLNTAGGTDTALYTKNSGAGNTGWVAVDNV